MRGIKKEIGGPDMPHDAHDAGFLGGPKCAVNPTKMIKIRAVGGTCDVAVIVKTSKEHKKTYCWQHLRCMTSMCGH